MLAELNADWSAGRIAELLFRNKICLSIGNCDLEELAFKCRDVDSGCPLDCDVPIDCPFGYKCSSVTASDWMGIGIRKGDFANAVMTAVSRCLRVQNAKMPARKKSSQPS